MTKEELVQHVKDEITASCSLPFAPSDAEILRIIDIESRWLYREYRDAAYTTWYLLDKRYYDTKEWKDTRTYQMPDCVLGVRQVYELTSGQRVFGISDPDMKFDRLMAADLYLSPLSSDQISYRTMQWSFWDSLRQFNLRDIQFSFNLNTKRLVILGRDLRQSLYIQTMNEIPKEEFYDDPIVIKWMIAKAKISLARILGTFNYNLFGNVTINYEQWRTEGREEIKELQDKINSDNVADWFYMLN